jgi:tetratricopeptide (TPR) repeat protein
MKFNQFLKECNEKDVFKKLSIYIVSSWVIIQVMAVIWQPLGLPKESITILIIILLIGFPINVYFVWKFHLLLFESEVLDDNGNIVEVNSLEKSFKKIYFSALGVISIISGILIVLITYNNFIANEKSTPIIFDVEKNGVVDKIAVLEFGNDTGNSEYDIVGKMAVDWIIHGITENELEQVVSPEIVKNYTNNLKTVSNFAAINTQQEALNYFKPNKIISGKFYLQNNKLLFQCSVSDGLTNEILKSFKMVECDSSNPLDCIEELKQVILGYLITEEDKLNLQEDFPPKFEAYQNVLDAKANSENEESYIDFLNKAIEIDPNYFEPKVLRVAYYYNNGNFKKADSLRKAIIPTSSGNIRQRNLLNLYDALLQGNNRKVYRFLKKEYQITPFDLETNYSAMVVALQYVNLPEDVEKYYNAISMKNMDLENCPSCIYRVYVKATVDLELNNYTEVIDTLQNIMRKNDISDLRKPLLSAYINTGNFSAVDSLLRKIELTSEKAVWQDLYLFIGNELLLIGDKKNADVYFNKIITTSENKENNAILASALYYKKDYVEAEKVLKKIYELNPKDFSNLSKLAVSLYKNGKQNEAAKVILEMNALDDDFQFGELYYALAQYYAAINDDENSIRNLFKSVAQGKRFKMDTYQNDPHFLSFRDNNQFQNILNFWH